MVQCSSLVGFPQSCHLLEVTVSFAHFSTAISFSYGVASMAKAPRAHWMITTTLHPSLISLNPHLLNPQETDFTGAHRQQAALPLWPIRPRLWARRGLLQKCNGKWKSRKRVQCWTHQHDYWLHLHFQLTLMLLWTGWQMGQRGCAKVWAAGCHRWLLLLFRFYSLADGNSSMTRIIKLHLHLQAEHSWSELSI